MRGRIPKNISETVRVSALHASPATLHAMCEDYRAAASIDLEHDQGPRRKVACPTAGAVGLKGAMHNLYDVLATWRERASDARGQGLACGHWMPEELPDEIYTQLRSFLTA